MVAPSAPQRAGAPHHAVTALAPVLLVRSAHPRQALLTAAGLAVAAALDGRTPREVGLVALTVLVGQALLGWDDDLADERADRADGRTDKPLVSGALDRGTLGFAMACATLLVIPLALSSGIDAGLAYLASVAVGVVGNRIRLLGVLSFLPWSVAFALYPAYLSYGGWGGAAHGQAPSVVMVVLAALLGACVHVLTSLRGLVDDNRSGRRHLPLRLALRVGAPRLLLLTAILSALVVGGMLVVGATSGLS